MRVLAIAQVHDFVEGKPQRFGESFLGSVQLKSSVRAHTLKRGSDSGIVRRRGGKSLLGKTPFCGRGKRPAGFGHLFSDSPVVFRRSYHSDILKILSRRADHGRSANIDIFNQFLKMHARLGCGFFKCIKIHHHHVDRLDAVLGDRRAMRGIFATVQNPPVDFGMQRFHPPIQHLWKSS